MCPLERKFNFCHLINKKCKLKRTIAPTIRTFPQVWTIIQIQYPTKQKKRKKNYKSKIKIKIKEKERLGTHA